MRKSATIIHKEQSNQVVREGELKKRNEYLIKQTRLFVLDRNGTMRYYKNKTMHRGTVILCNQTVLAKTSRTSFEVQTPSRTWYLYEIEPQTIDKWIYDIESVISTL